MLVSPRDIAGVELQLYDTVLHLANYGHAESKDGFISPAPSMRTGIIVDINPTTVTIAAQRGGLPALTQWHTLERPLDWMGLHNTIDVFAVDPLMLISLKHSEFGEGEGPNQFRRDVLDGCFQDHSTRAIKSASSAAKSPRVAVLAYCDHGLAIIPVYGRTSEMLRTSIRPFVQSVRVSHYETVQPSTAFSTDHWLRSVANNKFDNLNPSQHMRGRYYLHARVPLSHEDTLRAQYHESIAPSVKIGSRLVDATIGLKQVPPQLVPYISHHMEWAELADLILNA